MVNLEDKHQWKEDGFTLKNLKDDYDWEKNKQTETR